MPSRFSRLFLFVTFFALGNLRAAAWKTLTDCRLAANEYGDGDSFHIRSGSRDYIIRLYFVDCAETEATFPERVAEQAAYWKIDVAKALQLGREAERFTKEKLSTPFTVVTQLEDARGASNQRRYFGFVLPNGGRENLAELLVANGLARIYGAPGKPPDGRDQEAFKQQLHRLENDAKAKRLGGWGGVKPSADSNDDFFNRARSVAPPAATPMPARLPQSSVQGRPKAKLRLAPDGSSLTNLNTATEKELEALPKIGKVLAARIIEGRPYRAIEDLARVQGISPKLIETISPYLEVGGS